jgi:hypothetical protein
MAEEEIDLAGGQRGDLAGRGGEEGLEELLGERGGEETESDDVLAVSSTR